jgi:GntR family transcriptional regulator of arabinose operon
MLKGKELLNVKIERFIKDLINTQQLKNGDRLLPERELGKLFNTSPRPVRQATASLVKEGILEKIQGKGTFVKAGPVDQAKGSVTDRIGILFWPPTDVFLTNFYYTTILRGIQAQAEEQGKSLLFRSLKLKEDETIQDLFKSFNRQVDGIIMVDILPIQRKQVDYILKEFDQPVVVLHCEDAPEQTDSVVFDTFNHARKLVTFLVGLGHTRIAKVRAEGKHYKGLESAYGINFTKGFRTALEEKGITPGPEQEIILNSMSDSTTLAAALKAPNAPTAIMCGGDEVAVAVMNLAQEIGLNIPEDLTVVGCSDLKEMENTKPGLTTMHLPLEEMGVLGFRRLTELMDNKKNSHPHGYKIVLTGYLVERQSHKSIH